LICEWERDYRIGAESCALVLASAWADLRRCDMIRARGVVPTILTSEGPLVRTQLRPPSFSS